MSPAIDESFSFAANRSMWLKKGRQRNHMTKLGGADDNQFTTHITKISKSSLNTVPVTGWYHLQNYVQMFQIVCEVSLFSPSDNESATAAAPSSSSYKPSPSTASLPSRLQKNKHTPDLVLDLPGTPSAGTDSGSVSLNNTPTTPKVIGRIYLGGSQVLSPTKRCFPGSKNGRLNVPPPI